MHPQTTERPRDGIVVASGYGLKLYINRGHLIVHDGICADRQTRRYHRATSKLKRIIVIGHTGYVTLDALRWIRDVGGALVQIDADGTLLTTTAPNGLDHAALRRAQALAATSPTGLEIARGILDAKVAGQASLLGELPDGAGREPDMDAAITRVRGATNIGDLIAAEAAAANAYWDAWSGVGVRFGKSDECRVPHHWLTLGHRHSPLTRSPRTAANPANAILNYLYSLLEAETTLACHTVGLDPGLGLFHADRRDRASLALDIMEACRPSIDAYLLALLSQRTLRVRDFVETRRGACRLLPPLAQELATSTTTWRAHVEPVVEQVAHTFASHSPATLKLGSPLTGSARIAAWKGRRRKAKQRPVAIPSLARACRDCGEPLPDRRRRYCDNCRRARWPQIGAAGRPVAAQILAGLRANGQDPAHGGRAAESRGRKNAAHQRAVGEWKGERPEPATFQSEILPGLRQAPIGELVAATGLSVHYCSLIRLGKRTPHPRHWEALKNLGAISRPHQNRFE